MSRVTLSEFAAKRLLFKELGRKYRGLSVDLENKNYQKSVNKLSDKSLYVAKVDQAVKKRGQSGLIKLRRTKKQIGADLRRFARQGFRYALVEPYIEHQPDQERYVALSRTRDGVMLSHSKKGGVDIEEYSAEVHHEFLDEMGQRTNRHIKGPDSRLTTMLYSLFQKTHMTLLEINPLIVKSGVYIPLDIAAQVDSAGQFFVEGAWEDTDVREPKTAAHKSEKFIEGLNAKSPASLSLKVLNPDGALFLLLSGGGASVVIADELAHYSDYREIANYGEYSGNPSEDETYLYTKEILGLLLNSKRRHKALIIAGGVANFTDVYRTFAGIIRAMQAHASELKKQKIEVYVRRGGPNQEKGLKAMSNFLEELGIYHAVSGPDKSLAKIIAEAARSAG